MKTRLLREKKELTDQKNDADVHIKEINARASANRSIYKALKKQVESIADTEQKLRWVKALADTAGGNLQGREKVMLETYVQTAYFDRIISRANVRFMVMSGGQYELKRSSTADNNRSQSGLSLDVVDHYREKREDAVRWRILQGVAVPGTGPFGRDTGIGRRHQAGYHVHR